MALAAECSVHGGDAEYRDVFGFCSAAQFGSFCQLELPDRTLESMVLDYTRSVLETLDFVNRSEVEHGRKPNVADTVAYFHSQTAQTGVHSFPALVVGNDQAQLAIITECARWLELDGELSAFGDDDRQRVERLFADVCLLDSQLHPGLQPITARSCPGFALDDVRCCVPLLHAGTGALRDVCFDGSLV